MPPLTEMSSAVTLTDPVSLTEWPFALSQTDVCSCQSHALKKTRGSYNMARIQQTHVFTFSRSVEHQRSLSVVSSLNWTLGTGLTNGALFSPNAEC